MLATIDVRTEIAQRKFVQGEERSFYSRAHADVAVGLWVAARLGLDDEAAKAYAADVMAAGVDSAGGRGGFEKLARDLSTGSADLDALRTRYALALENYLVGTA